MTAFIIDTYNRFDQFDRDTARFIFEVNEVWDAVKEVYLKWGKPKLPLRIGDERDKEQYRIYDTYEDAFEFAMQMKNLNK